MTIKQQGGVFGRNPTFNDVSVEGTLTADTVSLGGDLSLTSLTLDGTPVTATGAELNYLDITTLGRGEASKAVTADASGNVFLGNKAFLSDINAGHAFAQGANAGLGYSARDGMIHSYNQLGSGGQTIRFLYQGSVAGYIDIYNTYATFRPSNGGGIDFSATAGTGTSELFDDYEEGTWTPVFSDASSGGNTASGSSYGYYVKVGGLVYVTGQFENVNTTGMTGGNLLYVQGIPYTPSSLANDIFFMGSVKSDGVTNSGFVNVEAIDNYAWLRFSETNNTTAGHLTVSDFASGTADIFFSLCYRAI